MPADDAWNAVRTLVYFSMSGQPDRQDHAAAILIEIHNALTGDRVSHHEWQRAELDSFWRVSSSVSESLEWAARSGHLCIEDLQPSEQAPIVEEDAPDTVPQPFVGDETTFVAVRLVDQNGNAVPLAAFRLTLPDATIKSGSMSSQGAMLFDGITPPGLCSIVFPEFDASDFAKPIALPGSRGPGTNEPVTAEGSGRIHVATATDTLVSIGEQFGFVNFETVWNAPGNRGLRAKRESPQTLLPGDEVIIPEKRNATHRASTGTNATITVFCPRIRVRIKLLTFDGRALAGAHAKVAARGAPDELDADGDGVFDVPIAANARDLSLGVNGAVRSFAVGVLGPIDSPSGIRHRLASLGYDAGDDDDETDEALRWAVEEFERDHGHKPTGKIDDGFLDRLSDAHGT